MTHQSGAAFRPALEDRLLAESQHAQVPLVRIRKFVMCDRILSRLIQSHPDRWLLEGDLALQLHLSMRAGTTSNVYVLRLAPAAQRRRMLVNRVPQCQAHGA